MEIGSSYTQTVEADDKVIREIARVSGDTNPIHLDDTYAKNTIFGRRIAHALFCHNIISMIIGNYMPGNGTILVSQSFHYQYPVYIGDAIKTTVTVEKYLSKGKYLLSVVCKNQENKTVLDGDAVVKC